MSLYFLESLGFIEKSNIQKITTEKAKIFFSYAWREGENIVNELYESLKKDGDQKGYKIVRDKEDLTYRESISEFMKDIGKGNYVVIAFSDKYLKSEYCMFELYELFRNSKLEKSALIKKVFPIRVENINLNDPETIAKYLDYWHDKEQQWENLITKFGSKTPSEFRIKYDKVHSISSSLGSLLEVLEDMHSLNSEELTKNDFAEVKEAIVKSIGLNRN